MNPESITPAPYPPSSDHLYIIIPSYNSFGHPPSIENYALELRLPQFLALRIFHAVLERRKTYLLNLKRAQRRGEFFTVTFGNAHLVGSYYPGGLVKAIESGTAPPFLL